MDISHMAKLVRGFVPPIHPEGHMFVAGFAMVSVLLWAMYTPLGLVGLAATIWCALFFRDPVRVVPKGEGYIVSPADGIVSKIEKIAPPEELGLGAEEVVRISVFLNVFNVHINRIPIAGEITALNYRPGKFLSADLDKASAENERQSVVIRTSGGKTIVCVQIAGLIARRILCYLEDKQQVKTGERYGLIRFGSRCDVYLPAGVNPLVVEGQTAVGGETILADLSGNETARTGDVI